MTDKTPTEDALEQVNAIVSNPLFICRMNGAEAETLALNLTLLLTWIERARENARQVSELTYDYHARQAARDLLAEIGG